MQRTTIGALTAAVLAVVLLGGCADDSEDCGEATYYSEVDHHYHYGSPTGKTVPDSKAPKAATPKSVKPTTKVK